MLIVLRLALWAAALFLAASPVLLGIAKSPSQMVQVFNLESYSGVKRDLIFLAIAFLAIALVDAFDSIANCIDSESGQGQIIAISSVLVIAIVVQMIVYASWAAYTNISDVNATVHGILYIILFSFLNAFASRMILIFGATP